MNAPATAPRVIAAPHRTIRLLYVINGLGRGGAERSLAELLPYLLEHGVELTIVCLKHMAEGVEQEVRRLACRIHILPPGTMVASARRLRRILRAERPDLVQTTLFESDLVGRLAAAGTGIPVLTSLVNMSYEKVRLSDPNVRRGRLLAVRLLDALSARLLTTHFHAVSHAVKKSSARKLYLPERRITVVARGRDPERLGSPSEERKREVRARLGIPAEARVIVNVARQEFQKGQRYLLEAMQTLAGERADLLLIVAGRPGHATPLLEKLHRASGLGDRIRFLGHRGDIPDILAAGDIFVFPSLFEGFGGAVLEAMALGLPIVATNIPPLREVMVEGKNGLLVEPESAADLAAALARLLDDPQLRAAYGSASSRIFSECFTLEQSAAAMMALYERLVPASRPLPGERYG